MFESSLEMRQVLIELMYALRDALNNGDLWGHLRAWWEVALGRVAPDTRPDIRLSK